MFFSFLFQARGLHHQIFNYMTKGYCCLLSGICHVLSLTFTRSILGMYHQTFTILINPDTSFWKSALLCNSSSYSTSPSRSEISSSMIKCLYSKHTKVFTPHFSILRICSTVVLSDYCHDLIKKPLHMTQGSLLFQKIEFFIKADIRGWSFL